MKKIFSRLTALALVLCIALCAALPMFAEADSERSTLRVGFFGYSGFIDEGSDGTYSGYAVDYLNSISAYTGYSYIYVNDTWENLLERLADGDIDLLCTAQYTPERAALYDYASSPIGYESAILYVRSDNDDYYYEDFASFNGMRVGRLADSYQNAIFDEYAASHGFTYTPVDFSSTTATFDALKNGDVDGVIMGSIAVETDYKIVARFSSDPFFLITTKGNTDIVQKLNYALEEISVTNPYYAAELYQKYYESAFLNITPAFTREEAQYIAASDVIDVGIMTNRFPLAATDDETGELYGIQIDAMNLISKLSGLTFRYVPLEAGQTAVDFLENISGALVAGLTKSNFSRVSGLIYLSEPFMTDNLCFVGRTGEMLDDTQPFTFALPVSYINGKELLSKLYPQADFITCEDNISCMRSILSGEADFMVQDYYVVSAILQNPRYAGLSVLNEYSFSQDACVGMLDGGNKTLISIINKCIRRIDSRDITNSVSKYTTGSPYQMSIGDFVYKYRYGVGIGASMLIALIGLLLVLMQMRRRNEKTLEAKNAQLNDAIQEAENANKAKSVFLSNMSHDIRTPMNVIINMTQMAYDEAENPDAVHDYLSKIKRTGKYLLGLINNILDVTKIENGKIELHPEPYRYSSFVAGICSLIEPMCEEKSLTFEINKSAVLPAVMADVTRLNQIFYNLLSNAAKYTPNGGTIGLKIENEVIKNGASAFDVVVYDNGIGMSDEFQQKMFERFTQEDTGNRAELSQLNGTGLGLSIAKTFTEAMGGTISVASKLGEGTRFTVHLELPLAFDTAPEAPQQSTEDIAGMKLLVVEDHPLNAEIARRLLEKRGAQVTVCENGALGVKAFEASDINWYDAILMDIRMPIMDGLEATRVIRGLTRADAKTIPIIAMTANAYESDKQQSLSAGMTAHISKPIEPRLLYETLAKQRGKSNA